MTDRTGSSRNRTIPGPPRHWALLLLLARLPPLRRSCAARAFIFVRACNLFLHSARCTTRVIARVSPFLTTCRVCAHFARTTSTLPLTSTSLASSLLLVDFAGSRGGSSALVLPPLVRFTYRRTWITSPPAFSVVRCAFSFRHTAAWHALRAVLSVALAPQTVAAFGWFARRLFRCMVCYRGTLPAVPPWRLSRSPFLRARVNVAYMFTVPRHRAYGFAATLNKTRRRAINVAFAFISSCAAGWHSSSVRSRGGDFHFASPCQRWRTPHTCNIS